MKRTKKSHVATVLVSLAFTATVLAGVMFFAGFWTLSSTYDVSAYVQNARGIAEDSTVFEAGLPVGLVTGVRRMGPDAILSLQITSGERPLPVDSRVQLGLRSLAGEAEVLLHPGTSEQTVRNGGSLGLSQSNDFTEVDQILNELSGYTQGTAREFFQGLGGGLKGEGINLNNTLGAFASLVNDSPPLTSTIAYQHNHLADIVQNFGNIMDAIGQRNQALGEFARGADTTFTAIANRDSQLVSTINEVKYGLAGADASLNGLTNYTGEIAPVLYKLSTAVTKLQPAINELTPASQRGIQILDALSGASPQLRNVLVNLEQLKPAATQALPAMHYVTCQLDPMINYLAPYGPNISAFFMNFGAATDAYSSASHELLTSATIDPSHLFAGVYSQPTDNAVETLINFGIFHKLSASNTGFDPEPGVAGANQPLGKAGPLIGLGVNGAGEFGATHPYPHVNSACPAPSQ